MGILYLVATPIGNLEDMNPRGVRILREVRLIAAEDTRVSRKLLSAFDIHTPLTSYFEHNKLGKLDVVLSALAEGDVALVSDAGTPTINDPGYELVKAALAAGYNICPVPGPSAPLAALAASGLPTDAFLYLGYLPRKSSERRVLAEQVAQMPFTLVFLEAPHRLLAALADLESALGDREIAIARELTKLHEEIWHGRISRARAHFSVQAPRGEFTLVVDGLRTLQRLKGGSPDKGKWSQSKVDLALKVGLKLSENPSALAKRVAEESGWERREVYKRITALKE